MKQDNSDIRPRVDRAWDKMDLILDQNFSKKKERRFFIFWIGGLLGLSLIALTWMLSNKQGLNNETIHDDSSYNNNLAVVEKSKEEFIISNDKDPIINQNKTKESDLVIPTETSLITSQTSNIKSKLKTETKTRNQNIAQDALSAIYASMEVDNSKEVEEGLQLTTNHGVTHSVTQDTEIPTIITQSNESENSNLKPSTVATFSSLPLSFNLVWTANKLLIDTDLASFSPADQNILLKLDSRPKSLWAIAAAFERAPDLEANGISVGVNRSWRMGKFSVGAEVGASYFRPAYFNNHLLVSQEEELKVVDVQDVDNAPGGSNEDEIGTGANQNISNIRIDKKDVFGFNLGLSMNYHIDKTFIFSNLGFDYFISKPTEVFSSNGFMNSGELSFDDYINEKELLTFVELGLGHSINPHLSLFASYKYSLKNYFELDETKLKASRVRVGLKWVI